MDNPSALNNGRFRPASMADFTRYARDLGEMLEQPLQAAQQLLAKLYGYADLHELKISLSVAGEAGPYEDKVELEVPDCLKELFYDEFGSAAPRELLAILDEKMMQRAQRTWSLLVEQCGLQRSLPRANPAHALVAAGGFFSSPSAHRAAMSRVRLALAQPSEDDFGIDVTNWPWARLALRTSVAYAISWVGQIDVGKINKEAPDRGPSHEDTPGWAPGADAFVAVAEQAAKPCSIGGEFCHQFVGGRHDSFLLAFAHDVESPRWLPVHVRLHEEVPHRVAHHLRDPQPPKEQQTEQPTRSGVGGDLDRGVPLQAFDGLFDHFPQVLFQVARDSRRRMFPSHLAQRQWVVHEVARVLEPA